MYNLKIAKQIEENLVRTKIEKEEKIGEITKRKRKISHQ